MKNLKKFAFSRAGVVSIASLGIILFSISTIEISSKKISYEVVQSKISLSGSYSIDKWTLQANSIVSTGDFEIKDQELLSISNLSFSISTEALKSNNHQLESILQEIFSRNNCKEITFNQQHMMILPIMKRAQVIGNFSMANGSHSLPIQLHYELTGDQNLRIWGSQIISLAEFGVQVPSYEDGTIADEIELEIDILLEHTTAKT